MSWMGFVIPKWSPQVRRQGRRGDAPRTKAVLGDPGSKTPNLLATGDIEAKIQAVNTELEEEEEAEDKEEVEVDTGEPTPEVIVSIKTSARMKSALIEQRIVGQLIQAFTPTTTKVVVLSVISFLFFLHIFVSLFALFHILAGGCDGGRGRDGEGGAGGDRGGHLGRGQGHDRRRRPQV